MRPKLVRALLTLVAVVVTWLVAPSAFAATSRAPVCDPRGAIGFAPNPQLQDVQQSLDAPADEDACGGSEENLRHAERDRAPRGAEGTSSSDPTIARSAGAIVAPLSTRVPAPEASARGARPAHALALERPPRA